MATKTLLTAEQFARLPATDMRQELDEGELIEMPPAQKAHGKLIVRIARLLDGFIATNHLGECVSNAGFRLSRDPDVVRAPDVCFIRKDRLHEFDQPQTYPDGCPDLVIEVASQHDIASALLRKVHQYLAAGAQAVWVIFPDQREAHVYDPSGQPRVIGPGGELTHPELLPGFTLALNELFA